MEGMDYYILIRREMVIATGTPESWGLADECWCDERSRNGNGKVYGIWMIYFIVGINLVQSFICVLIGCKGAWNNDFLL